MNNFVESVRRLLGIAVRLDRTAADVGAARRAEAAALQAAGLAATPRGARVVAVDGRALGARVDALEEAALWSLNRAKQMLLRGRWRDAREAVGAADGALAGLAEIEDEAQRIAAEGAEDAENGAGRGTR